jgi:hypothetical protein
MDQKEKDAGTIVALITRMRLSRIPRARRLLARVDAGLRLSDYEVAYLERVFADARDLYPLLDRNPDYGRVVSRMIDLYAEITEKALRNEKVGQA